MDKSTLRKIVAIEKQAKNEPVTITLDWLSIYFVQSGQFPENISDGDSLAVSYYDGAKKEQVTIDNIYLVGINKPTLHFNSMYSVILDGEEVGALLLNSKNAKFFERNIVKLEIKNHALYSGAWIEVVEKLQKFGLIYKACGRIDIAIDGMNSMHQLLNLYAKQNLYNKTLQLKNSSEARARFSAKVLNPKTMLFENFNVGGNGGNKMITVYNKSLEIVKSGKKYIQEFWLRSGIIAELQDLDEQATAIEKWEAKGYETFHLEGFRNVYRFEIRLKSESIKEIEDFSLDMLMDSAGLASIVKLHCKKFFEPILCDDPKPSRCKPVDIIPFDRLQAVRLEKITRAETDGVYKAKITIHGIVQDLYRGRIEKAKIDECISAIMDRVTRYRLAYYIDNKLDEWHKRYSGSTVTDDEKIVEDSMCKILTMIMPMVADRYKEIAIEDYYSAWDARISKGRNDGNNMGFVKNKKKDLAGRHDQANATADFGEDEGFMRDLLKQAK